MFLGGLFMIYLLLKEHYLDMTTCARCEAVDNAIFKVFGNMIWESMPDSVTEKCYGCSGVVGEEGVPKFFGSQRDHDVCCMMNAEEQIDYVSPDVIHKILTNQTLREEFWARLEIELEDDQDKTLLKELLSKNGPGNSTVDESWILQNIDKITKHAKYLYNKYSSSTAVQETSLYKRKK